MYRSHYEGLRAAKPPGEEQLAFNGNADTARCRPSHVTTGESTRALTEVERALVEHVERGETLDLAGEQPVDTATMHLWGREQTVRAWVVRDILRGRLSTDADPHGLRLRGARIAGRIDLENVTSAVAFELEDCLLDEGIIARGAHLQDLVLLRCHLTHPSAPPMDAARLTTALLIATGTTVDGHCGAGALHVRDAQLGQLICTDATLFNDAGPALMAQGAHVEHSVVLDGSFTAIGSGRDGAVSLLGTRIGLHLDCAGATLRNASGPAIFGNLLQAQSVFLRGGFEATGAGELGAVRLLSVDVGSVDCGGISLSNPSGPALLLTGRVARNVSLVKFTATGAGGNVVVGLAGLQIGGVLWFDPQRLEHDTDPQRRLHIDGLSYSRLPLGITTDAWLTLLREGTPGYTAHPYQQLAAAHRAAGHDSEARRVLMTQRRDQVNRHALTGRAERAWVRLTGLTLGYGYQPWRALIGLLIVIAAAALIAIVVGGHNGLVQVRTPPVPAPASCAITERIAVGLDLGSPLITSGGRVRCEAAGSVLGQMFTVTGWFLRLLAWAFATLFIAGFTGAVRKT